MLTVNQNTHTACVYWNFNNSFNLIGFFVLVFKELQSAIFDIYKVHWNTRKIRIKNEWPFTKAIIRICMHMCGKHNNIFSNIYLNRWLQPYHHPPLARLHQPLRILHLKHLHSFKFRLFFYTQNEKQITWSKNKTCLFCKKNQKFKWLLRTVLIVLIRFFYICTLTRINVRTRKYMSSCIHNFVKFSYSSIFAHFEHDSLFFSISQLIWNCFNFAL